MALLELEISLSRETLKYRDPHMWLPYPFAFLLVLDPMPAAQGRRQFSVPRQAGERHVFQSPHVGFGFGFGFSGQPREVACLHREATGCPERCLILAIYSLLIPSAPAPGDEKPFPDKCAVRVEADVSKLGMRLHSYRISCPCSQESVRRGHDI